MKSPLRILLFTCFLISLFPSLVSSQQSSFQTILFNYFDGKNQKNVIREQQTVFFQINNSTVTRISVNNDNFYFLIGADGKSFGLANFYFGKKDEKSFIEIYLLDENFSVKFYKKLDLAYEEQLPIIVQISSTQVALLYRSLGLLKILDSDKEKVINLLKKDVNNIFPERIGHLLVFEDKLIAILSQIKKEDKYISKVFEYNLSKDDLSEFEIDANIIYKVFNSNGKLFLTSLNTEPTFSGGFYFLEQNQLGNSLLQKISDDFIEGQVRNLENTFYSRNCFYKLENENLISLNVCFPDEIILDAVYINGKILILTRSQLITKFYEMNSEFQISSEETIDLFLANPTLKLVEKNKISIIDKNKTILTKIISEDK